MKLGKRILAGLLIGALFTVSACSSPSAQSAPASDTPEKAAEITFMIPEWGAPSQEMLEEFQKEKNIKVNVETVEWDAVRNKISIAAAGKKAAADVFEVDWAWVGEFTSAGWIHPIDLSDEDKKEFIGIDTFTVNHQVMALSYANDFRISYMNTEMFDKAGVAEPNTWDDVHAAARIIKEQGVTQYPFAFPLAAEESATTSLFWLTFMRDGKVFNDDNTLHKENLLKSLTYVDTMLKEGLIDPANKTMKGSKTYAQLTEGSAAFMTGPSSYVGRIEDPNQSKVLGKAKAIMPLGSTGKATQTMALQEAVGVSPYSENKEAAMIFVKWFTSPEIQEKMFEAKGCVPTRATVLNKLIDSGQIKGSKTMMDTAKLIKSIFPAGVPKYYTEMSAAVFNAVNKMALGQLTPQQALEEMDAKVSALAKK